MAFGYTVLPTTDSDRVERRLRIHTVQLGVADRPLDLYQSADADSILSLLTLKVIRSCLDEGIEEGRLLVQDWLTILLKNYHEGITLSAKGISPSSSSSNRFVDMAFSKSTNLRNLSRYVFALLKSPLLSNSEHCDPDYWSYLHLLYR